MIAISGSTGQLGQLVVQSLLNKHVKAAEIVALARDPHKLKALSDKGVQVRKADYNDPKSLDAALLGVDRLLFISSSDLAKRLSQHRALVDAAQRNGKIKLIAYTSILHADHSPLGLAKDHIETETYIKKANLPYVFLRNGWYNENYISGAPSAIAQGTLFGGADEGKISSASRADFADAAAVVLTGQGHEGKIYELAGDKSYTLSEFAAELSKLAGKSIPYVNLPQIEYRAMLVKVGLPEAVADLLSDSDVGISKGGLFNESGDLQRLIGRATEPFQETLRRALKK